MLREKSRAFSKAKAYQAKMQEFLRALGTTKIVNNNEV
jgi:hypothetical protein